MLAQKLGKLVKQKH